LVVQNDCQGLSDKTVTVLLPSVMHTYAKLIFCWCYYEHNISVAVDDRKGTTSCHFISDTEI